MSLFSPPSKELKIVSPLFLSSVAVTFTFETAVRRYGPIDEYSRSESIFSHKIKLASRERLRLPLISVDIVVIYIGTRNYQPRHARTHAYAYAYIDVYMYCTCQYWSTQYRAVSSKTGMHEIKSRSLEKEILV